MSRDCGRTALEYGCSTTERFVGAYFFCPEAQCVSCDRLRASLVAAKTDSDERERYCKFIDRHIRSHAGTYRKDPNTTYRNLKIAVPEAYRARIVNLYRALDGFDLVFSNSEVSFK